MGGFKATPIEERVWRHVEKRGPDECWWWKGSLNKGGYGVIAYGPEGDRHSTTASRAVWISAHGPIPEGMAVLHTCDKPPCCNPAHLFLGTPKDNYDDMVAKGRRGKPGGFFPRINKLTDDQVRQIRILIGRGLKNHQVAVKFNVSETTVWAIKTGRRKQHVR